MKTIGAMLIFSLLIVSCAHKEKDILVTDSPPPEETGLASPSTAIGPVHVALRGYKQIRASGMVHFVQDQSVVHMEVMLEGMKPGPYKINLNDSKKCKSAKASKGRDLGEVVADAKGKVKSTFDLTHLQSQDLIGRKLIVYTTEKGKTKVAACGLPEKMDAGK